MCLEKESFEEWKVKNNQLIFKYKIIWKSQKIINCKGVYKGWKTSDYYNGDNLIKRKTYFDKDKNKTLFAYSQSDLGIWSIDVYPFYIILERLVYFGIIGKEDEIIIASIKNNGH